MVKSGSSSPQELPPSSSRKRSHGDGKDETDPADGDDDAPASAPAATSPQNTTASSQGEKDSAPVATTSSQGEKDSAPVASTEEIITDTTSDEDVLPIEHTPVVTDTTVEFSLAAIHQTLICKLCHGYFKEPYMIKDCLHAFCKSCLFFLLRTPGDHHCPICHSHLASDPFKAAILDRSLQELVDRIIFPDLVEQELQQEAEFYEARGIRLKEHQSSASATSHAKKKQKIKEYMNVQQSKSSGNQSPPHQRLRHASPHPADSKQRTPSFDDKLLKFTLTPEIDTNTSTENAAGGTMHQPLPPLDRPRLEISGKFRMSQLKKYLVQTLGLSMLSQPSIEILCNGVPLGDEISLSFVRRLLWHNDSHDLALTYRTAENVC